MWIGLQNPNNLPCTKYAPRGKLSKLIKAMLITLFATLEVHSYKKETDTQIQRADARHCCVVQSIFLVFRTSSPLGAPLGPGTDSTPRTFKGPAKRSKCKT